MASCLVSCTIVERWKTQRVGGGLFTDAPARRLVGQIPSSHIEIGNNN